MRAPTRANDRYRPSRFPRGLSSVRVGWLCVTPTLYMRDAHRAARAAGLSCLVAYCRPAGAPRWPRLWRAVLRRRVDVLVVEGWSEPACVLAMLTAGVRRVPYVVSSDTWVSRSDRRGRRWLAHQLVGRAAALFPAGAPQARHLRELAWPRQLPTVVAHMTVDTSRFTDATEERRAATRAAWGASPETFVSLFVGRLVEEKGVLTALEAVEALRRDGRPALLVVSGDGPLRARLDRLTREGAAAHLTGHLDELELADAYGAADAFVLPSRFEPWGLVVNEAMAAGLPVVVSDAVGAREDLVLDGVTGASFPAGDAEALAARLRSFLDDPTLARRLGAEGRRRIEGWSMPTYVASLQAVVAVAAGIDGALCP